MMEQNKHHITTGLSTFITKGLNGWQAGFTIGVQTFYLQPVGCEVGDERDTEERAKWYQKALETAFKKLSPSPSGANVLVESLEKIKVIAKGGSIGLPAMLKDFQRIVTICTESLAQYNAVEPEKQTEEYKIKEEILNNCRGKEGAGYDPSYWNAALRAMDVYADQFKKALDEIANPVKYLQKEAERDGCKLNGGMANQLSNDANYLKSIAKKALEQNQPPSLPGETPIDREPEGDNFGFKGTVIGTIAYNPESGDLKVTPDPDPSEDLHRKQMNAD